MCIFLVTAQSATHSDPEKEVRGCYKRGDVVSVHEEDDPYFVDSGDGYRFFPKHVAIEATGLDSALAADKVLSWQMVIDYEIVQTNLQVDWARIRIFVVDPGALNEFGITRDQVETWLQGWGATIVTADTNEIRFEQTIEEIYTSDKYWRGDLLAAGVVITETAYNLAQGEHTAIIDVSGSAATTDQIVERLAYRGVIPESIVGEVVTAIFERTATRDIFLQELDGHIRDTVVRRKWRFTEAAVAAAETAEGFAAVTPAVANANLVDKSL